MIKTLLQELAFQELALTLLEYQRDKTEKSLGSKLSQAGEKDNGVDFSRILDVLEKIDPTNNKQFVEWLCRQYIQSNFKLEDEPRVNEVLVRFEKIKNKLEQKDINRYNFHQLQSLMDKHFDEVELADVDAKAVKGAKILYDGPLGQLTIPTNKKAACELGSGTKWCTSAKSNNMFAHYNSQGPLYIWKDKSGEKFQFHFESGQFMDDKDAPISETKVQEFRNKNPVLKKLFERKEKELLENSDAVQNRRAIIDYWKKFIKVQWDQLEASILSTKNYSLAYDYLFELNKQKKKWEKGEDLIKDSPEYAFKYATSVLKKPWPEAEDLILKDRRFGILYRNEFPKSSFKSFAKQ